MKLNIKKYKNDPVFKNIIWLFSEKIFRLSINFCIGIWLAKYLGPSDFGVLNYALAIAVIIGAFSELGLSSLITKELVEKVEQRNVILGTSFVLRLIISIFMITATITIVSYSHYDYTSKVLIFIFSFIIVAQTVDVIDLWFQSAILSKYTVLARNTGLFLSSIIKVILIFNNASIYYIGVAILLEYVFTSLILVYYYRKTNDKIGRWKYDYQVAKYMITSSWPLIFSTVATMVYLKTDQIMLKQLIDNHEVGIYSVVVKLTEVWYFVPNAIVTSLYPSLVLLKNSNHLAYNEKLQKIFDLLFMISFSVALPISLFSNQIINLLYGNQYAESGPVLTIQIWTAIFIFSSILVNRWLINENLLIFTFISSGLGAIINVALNIILIPKYGAIGSSYSTLVSYIFSTIIFCFFSKKTRNLGYMVLKSYVYPFRILYNKLIKIS